MALVDLKADGEASEVGAALQDAQLAAFGHIMRHLVFAGGTRVAGHDRRVIAHMASEAYAASYPKLERGLELAGIPTNLVEELRAGMILANGLGAMRRKIKEKFITWATAS
ncbi:unnamed protein product [Phytomonas sp. EM1]|nr:unnamed protein product [Phytomonas sp. EM1]|eukprot:CCW60127.1 unnamed protein product [Phytomonas sp. isolate EM1]